MKRNDLVDNSSFAKESFLCVGLDTDIRKMPEIITGTPAERVYRLQQGHNRRHRTILRGLQAQPRILRKPGAEGWQVLADTNSKIRAKYPDQFIIADAKRGDIGNTAALYARTFFGTMDVDAVTLAPHTWAKTP